MKQVAITGVNGFVGKHLTRELSAQGLDVYGLGREVGPHQAIARELRQYFACDLTDVDSVSKLPLEKFETIINLAGFAQVGASFGNSELYKKVNVSVLNVIGSDLIKRNLSPQVIAISTGAVYGSSQVLPLTEASKLVTEGSPYALSKILMEKAAADLRKRGLDCIVARPFNHIGPGQEPGFLVPDLFNKIIEAKKSGNPIKVGNLTTKRDYTDVRDVVRAYAALALAKNLHYDTYNVCSGRSISGKVVLQTLLSATGSKESIEMEEDPSLVRPNDPPDLYGSNARLQEDTGWQPQIAFEQTIKDFVNSKV